MLTEKSSAARGDGGATSKFALENSSSSFGRARDLLVRGGAGAHGIGLQFVSKLSGFDKPSKDKARAVSKSLLGALETTAPSRTREAEAARRGRVRRSGSLDS